jgi:hypothetical protein
MKGQRSKRLAIVAVAGLLSLTVVVSSGCDSLIIVTAPSVTTGIGGSRPSLEAFVNLTCPFHTRPMADLIVIVSSPGFNLFVDVISLQSSAGGSIVAFSRPTLDAQFGNTLVSAGTTRRFRLTSALACAPAGWKSMRVGVRLLTTSGAAQMLTTTVVEEDGAPPS